MIEASLREPLESVGAIFADLGGVQVVRHYGEPAAEYRAIRETVGIVVRSDLARVRLWGRDPVRMVNGLITNDLAALSNERAVYGFALTAKGRVITDLRVLSWPSSTGSELMVDVPTAALPRIGEHFKKFLPPLFSRWEPVHDRLIAIGVYGPKAREVLAGLLSEEPDLAEDRVTRGTWQEAPITAIASRIAGGEEGYELLVPAERAAELWDELGKRSDALGGRPAGHAALETSRIEAGRPRFGTELTEETLAAEALESTGLMERTISFQKGCYTGQEVVIRIAHRGHVNRQLRGLLLGDQAAPALRTPLHAADTGKEVGWITSAAHSPRLEQTIALGYLRREIVPPASVHLGSPTGTAIEVTDLPLTP
ncbi:MAG: glycine cleavage T C-terminal barrel domain-containing protein [Gemmatimonadota bacterium]